jgi:hypothetical protein
MYKFYNHWIKRIGGPTLHSLGDVAVYNTKLSFQSSRGLPVLTVLLPTLVRNWWLV